MKPAVPLRGRLRHCGTAGSDSEQARLFEQVDLRVRPSSGSTAGCVLRNRAGVGSAVPPLRRSKTPAGWRTPTLNDTCLAALADLRRLAAELGYAQPAHFAFPWHGRDRRLDPTRPMTSWRSAWRSMLKAAGLTGVRFHDGRHTAITTLAEKGLPDEVIRAQVGHVSPDMMKTYSHIRRQALDRATAALEPTVPHTPTAVNTATRGLRHSPRHKKGGDGGRVVRFARKNGSSGRTRTYNPPVNSRMLCQLSY